MGRRSYELCGCAARHTDEPGLNHRDLAFQKGRHAIVSSKIRVRFWAGGI
ncbi:MAG: hypothetical protein R2941_21445 [Desulfobacterales bacterium]